MHDRQHRYVSTTNLNVNGESAQSQQQSKRMFVHSSPYLSQIRDDDSSICKSSLQQQQPDRHSTCGSDSGIVMGNSNLQRQQIHEDQLVEKKLTDLVQQLGKQLENDTQKIDEKLELKLKNLEDMIHQQTYIVRQQDEVIEHLKSKILNIETERNHFRERLFVHEQRERDGKKTKDKRKSPNSTSTCSDKSKSSSEKVKRL